jgi:hypothetical protein
VLKLAGVSRFVGKVKQARCVVKSKKCFFVSAKWVIC